MLTQIRHKNEIRRGTMIRVLSAALICVSGLVTGTKPAEAGQPQPHRTNQRPCEGELATTPPAEPQADRTQGATLVESAIYQKVLRSTVFLVCPTSDTTASTGTGWVVDAERRLVVTNDHVVDKSIGVIAFFPEYKDGKLKTSKLDCVNLRGVTPIRGKLIDSDAKCDLALIQLESLPAGTQALTLAETSPLQAERVHSVGNGGPTNTLWLYTTGSVRQIHRYRARGVDGGRDFDCRVVATDSPVNKGDSGGPVVNDRGELVAVVAKGCRDANLMMLMVDITEVRAYLDEVLPLVQPQTAKQFNNRGYRHHRQRRYDEALRNYAEALRLDPGYLTAVANRGYSFYEKGDYRTALADFNAAIAGGHRRPAAYYGRGITNLKLNNPVRAVADLTEAIRQKSEVASYYNERGLAYAAAGKRSQAVGDYTRAIKLNGREAVYYYNRGMSLKHLGRLDDAQRDFNRAAQLDPRNYKDRQKRFATKYVKVTNKTCEPITVHMVYVGVGPNGQVGWLPAHPSTGRTVRWVIQPGQSSQLFYDGAPVVAAMIGYRAESSTGAWKFKTRKLIDDGGYIAAEMETYSINFTD